MTKPDEIASFFSILSCFSYVLDAKNTLVGPVGPFLIVERNPPERIFLYMLKIFSQEDFALRSKLWPNNFS